MHSILLFLLILVPAPKTEPPHPAIGVWQIEWGNLRPTVTLRADGTAEFIGDFAGKFEGRGWTAREGFDTVTIWFSEGEFQFSYNAEFVPATGTGTGSRTANARVVWDAPIRLRRLELLPMPREIK